MQKVLLFLILFLLFSISPIQPLVAKPLQSETPQGIIACFSGGEEILRTEILSGPFADEYKFAHEVTVKDATGKHNLNFAGGLCFIDRGEVFPPKELVLTDQLSCYSGRFKIVTFEVYGRESTVDEYVEGRTFFAKAKGDAFNSNSLHEYLIFGGGACLGEETS